jgi:primosomal protein N'
MTGVVKQRPYCRHCGAEVKPLRRCPKCGKRAIATLFRSIWT